MSLDNLASGAAIVTMHLVVYKRNGQDTGYELFFNKQKAVQRIRRRIDFVLAEDIIAADSRGDAAEASKLAEIQNAVLSAKTFEGLMVAFKAYTNGEDHFLLQSLTTLFE